MKSRFAMGRLAVSWVPRSQIAGHPRKRGILTGRAISASESVAATEANSNEFYGNSGNVFPLHDPFLPPPPFPIGVGVGGFGLGVDRLWGLGFQVLGCRVAVRVLPLRHKVSKALELQGLRIFGV